MIELDKISLRVGHFALHNVSLTVPAGGYAALMGKTGSGKTTLLEAIIGLVRVTSGRIVLDGVDVTGENPAVRGIGYVPQDGALFSRMNVAGHLGFALEIRRIERKVIGERIGELADLLGIVPLLDRTPRNLSGGERQRVALGRALAFRPRILLLDEPLSALDDETRESMYDLLKRVRAATGVTTLHVTHSLAEAHELADVLFCVEDGAVIGEQLRAIPPVA